MTGPSAAAAATLCALDERRVMRIFARADCCLAHDADEAGCQHMQLPDDTQAFDQSNCAGVRATAMSMCLPLPWWCAELVGDDRGWAGRNRSGPAIIIRTDMLGQRSLRAGARSAAAGPSSDWLIHCKRAIGGIAWLTLRGLDCVLGGRWSGVGDLCARRQGRTVCQCVGDQHQSAGGAALNGATRYIINN